MQFQYSVGLIASVMLLLAASSSGSADLAWCQKAAKDFVDVAYRPDESGVLDNGKAESEVLDKLVRESQLQGNATVTDRMANRALYLRSRTRTPKSEAVTDVYGLCASLAAGGGRGQSNVLRGPDAVSDLSDKQAAWERYYQPSAECVSPDDWNVTVECGNARMRARAEFDSKWSAGQIRTGDR